MVMEASGGAWGPSARKVWNLIARASSRLTGEPHSQKAEEITQLLSATLQIANAQAVLRRCPPPIDLPSGCARAATALRNAEVCRIATAASVPG